MKRFSLTVLSAALLLFMVACSVTPVKKSLPVVEKKAEAKLETKVDAKTEPKNETKAETLRVVSFADLVGWAEDDLRQAWPAFIASCDVLGKRAVWKEVCASAVMVNAEDVTEVRNFFEGQFIPHVVNNADGDRKSVV
jgi:membrane-bound lytic murein transglycosylase A